MRTQTNIQILLSILLLFVVASSKGYSQDSPPSEKKRTLSKFDPSEVFPQAGERRDNGRRRGGNNESASSRDNNQAANSTDSASRRKAGQKKGNSSDQNEQTQNNSPSPTAVLSTVNRVPAQAPAPVATPAPATPEKQDPPPSSSTPEPVATPEVAAMTASSNQPPTSPLSTSISNPSGRDAGISLPMVIAILSLILLALVVVIIKLKKQFSAL